jgi:hypothetical protein
MFVFTASVVHSHVATGTGQGNGDCFADPSASTGYEGDFAGQIVDHGGHLSLRGKFQPQPVRHSLPSNGRTPSTWKWTRYLLSSSLIGGA